MLFEFLWIECLLLALWMHVWEYALHRILVFVGKMPQSIQTQHSRTQTQYTYKSFGYKWSKTDKHKTWLHARILIPHGVCVCLCEWKQNFGLCLRMNNASKNTLGPMRIVHLFICFFFVSRLRYVFWTLQLLFISSNFINILWCFILSVAENSHDSRTFALALYLSSHKCATIIQL